MLIVCMPPRIHWHGSSSSVNRETKATCAVCANHIKMLGSKQGCRARLKQALPCTPPSLCTAVAAGCDAFTDTSSVERPASAWSPAWVLCITCLTSSVMGNRPGPINLHNARDKHSVMGQPSALQGRIPHEQHACKTWKHITSCGSSRVGSQVHLV